MEVEPSPTSPAPLIQAEHSYSLCEEPRAQSPFTHVTTSDSFNDGKLRGGETPGALAPLARGSWRVWSVCSIVSTPFSHVPTPWKAMHLVCGEMPRGTGDISPPGTVSSGRSLSLNDGTIAFFGPVGWAAKHPFANQEGLCG